MNTIITIFVLTFMVAAILAFAYFQGAARRKSDIEKSQTLIYEETTGAVINGISYTMPFVRHSIYDGMVVIAWLTNNKSLLITEITVAELTKGIASEGLRYKGAGEADHFDATIWLRSKESVLSALNKAGVNVRT